MSQRPFSDFQNAKFMQSAPHLRILHEMAGQKKTYEALSLETMYSRIME